MLGKRQQARPSEEESETNASCSTQKKNKLITIGKDKYEYRANQRFCYITEESKLETLPKNKTITIGKDIREYLLSLSGLSNATSKEYRVAKEILSTITFISQEGKIPPPDEDEDNKVSAIIAGSYPTYLANRVKSYNDIDIFIEISTPFFNRHYYLLSLFCRYLHRKKCYPGVNGVWGVANCGRLQFILKDFSRRCYNSNRCKCENAFNKYFFSEFEHCTRYRLYFYKDESSIYKAIVKYIPQDADRQILAKRTCITVRDYDPDDDVVVSWGYIKRRQKKVYNEIASLNNMEHKDAILKLIDCGMMTKGTLRRMFPINYEVGPPRYPEKHLNNVMDFSPPSLWHQALAKYLKIKYIDWTDLTSEMRKELMDSDERICRWACGSDYQHILPETSRIFYVSD